MGHGTPSSARESAYYSRELAKLGKKQWKWWQQTYQPAEQEVMAQLRQPIEQQTYFKRMMGDVERQYGDVGANVRRTLGGRYQYGSGYEGEAAKNLELSRAGARAGAWQAGEEARQANLMTMMGMGRGLLTGATTGYGGATQGFGNVAGLQSQRDIAKMQGISGGVTGCICRNAIVVNELTPEVERFRDTFFEKGSFIDLGYKLYSMFNVPLVNKSRIWKFFMKYFCLKPLGAYADFFFGKNRYGFLLSPIGFFWVGLWVIMGATFGQVVDLSSCEEKFRKEMTQWVLQMSS